jgi:hypothetical protein
MRSLVMHASNASMMDASIRSETCSETCSETASNQRQLLMHAAQRRLLMHASNALKTGGAQDGGGEEDEGHLKRERGESKERGRREGGSTALSPI